MKFGKGLLKVVDVCNAEWGQYWINYKFLKKKINDIIEQQPSGINTESISQKGNTTNSQSNFNNAMNVNATSIAKSQGEVDFFKLIFKELKKVSDFFPTVEKEYQIRWERIWDSYNMLRDTRVVHDSNTWTRLLMACVKFYKDILSLEIFAIMNYCGFSKILKKHDKLTGYVTRDAFMRNVMSHQNFAHYPAVLELIKKSEKLFGDIQHMENVMPLQAEERLFIEALRGLNYQASRIQAEEKADGSTSNENNARSNSSDSIKSPIGLITTNPTLIANSQQKYTVTTAQRQEHMELPSAQMKVHDVDKKDAQITRVDALVEEFDAATSLVVNAAIKLNQRGHFVSLPHLIISSNNTPTIGKRKQESDHESEEGGNLSSNESSRRPSRELEGVESGMSGMEVNETSMEVIAEINDVELRKRVKSH